MPTEPTLRQESDFTQLQKTTFPEVQLQKDILDRAQDDCRGAEGDPREGESMTTRATKDRPTGRGHGAARTSIIRGAISAKPQQKRMTKHVHLICWVSVAQV